jgi:hypothetical protein
LPRNQAVNNLLFIAGAPDRLDEKIHRFINLDDRGCKAAFVTDVAAIFPYFLMTISRSSLLTAFPMAIASEKVSAPMGKMQNS